jgi:hypothetical protein
MIASPSTNIHDVRWVNANGDMEDCPSMLSPLQRFCARRRNGFEISQCSHREPEGPAPVNAALIG